jgi:hypothetical protein
MVLAVCFFAKNVTGLENNKNKLHYRDRYLFVFYSPCKNNNSPPKIPGFHPSAIIKTDGKKTGAAKMTLSVPSGAVKA